MFTAQNLRLWIPASLDDSLQRMEALMKDPTASSSGLSFLPGDLRAQHLEMHWQPSGSRQAKLVIEGKIRSGFSGSWLELQVSPAPTQQVIRLMWLGFTGLLFFLFLFGPPPPWTSLIPMTALFLMYFSQEQRFNESMRQFRALLCEKLEAEYLTDPLPPEEYLSEELGLEDEDEIDERRGTSFEGRGTKED
jgi:hypothetical protein